MNSEKIVDESKCNWWVVYWNQIQMIVSMTVAPIISIILELGAEWLSWIKTVICEGGEEWIDKYGS